MALSATCTHINWQPDVPVKKVPLLENPICCLTYPLTKQGAIIHVTPAALGKKMNAKGLHTLPAGHCVLCHLNSIAKCYPSQAARRMYCWVAISALNL